MKKTLCLLLLLFLQIVPYAQIRFRNYPNAVSHKDKITEMENSTVRKITMLNGKWMVYAEKDEDRTRSAVVIPSVYEGSEELIFEKNISVTKEQIDTKTLSVTFLGMQYSGDIMLNGSVIHRHTGGTYPFTIPLPRDILRAGNQNALEVKVTPPSGEGISIPARNQLLGPLAEAGIFRDVYITEKPQIAIQRYTIHQQYVQAGRARLLIDVNIANNSPARVDSASGTGFEIRVTAVPQQGGAASTASVNIDTKRGREREAQIWLEIPSPVLWSPESPSLYKVKIEIYKSGTLVDEVIRETGLYSLRAGRDSLYLNGKEFQLHGVAYVPVYKQYGPMLTYERMREDIILIKETGFNAVRFTKTLPHPYLLQLCASYGLLAFVDIPVEGIPSVLLSDNTFITTYKGYAAQWLAAYNNFSALAAIGIGGGFSGNDENDNFFLTQMVDFFHASTKKLLYAGFVPQTIHHEIRGIDFYGLETLNGGMAEIESAYRRWEGIIGKARMLISSAGYMTTEGSSNGYVNPYTNEAQAKYYADVHDYSDARGIAGFFLATMFDYRSNYSSLMGKYHPDNLIPLGIVNEDRLPERISYKVLFAILNNLQRATVPIGLKKERAPIVFIVFGLVLALLIGALVNSGKKFREEALRALVRPYNFFADIRDMRIISPLQSLMLAGIVSAISGLMTASFFHFLKYNIFFEKMLLSFGSGVLLWLMSFLAWHPFAAVWILTLFFFLLLGLATVTLRVASMSVMNRVFFSSTFYVVSWACIPVLLLTPLAIVLYRLLAAEYANLYIYGATAVMVVWLFFRMLKGAYVIFDTSKARVYFFGVFFVAAALGLSAWYLQSHFLMIDYLMHAVKIYQAGT